MASPKPAILCLHGRGTSAEIFRIQTIRLRRHLEDTFDFTFLDAPFVSPAGPGVVPVFEGCEPFYAWKLEPGVGGVAKPGTVQAVERALAAQLERTGRPFAGVMGFSQGGTLAAGVALREQAKRSATSEDGDESKWRAAFFTICLMSSCPPLVIGGEDPYDLDTILSPSLHVVGLQDDTNRGMSAAMANGYFSDPVILEVEAGHHLPSIPAETERLASAIRELYARASRRPR